ncbi:hypothetical protein T492DRAFT_1092530 [Pavlovales sp. CCMP2436]|nr:hypothetical protein T492DRAFT_1092530 [Pavlovales sp. CCMP2436]
MICWLLFVVFPHWAAIGASALKRASSSCAWPRAAIEPIVLMSCFLMRATASMGPTPISVYILRPPSLRRDFFDERVRVCADLTESANDDPADRLDGVELGLDRADAGVRFV